MDLHCDNDRSCEKTFGVSRCQVHSLSPNARDSKEPKLPKSAKWGAAKASWSDVPEGLGRSSTSAKQGEEHRKKQKLWKKIKNETRRSTNGESRQHLLAGRALDRTLCIFQLAQVSRIIMFHCCNALGGVVGMSLRLRSRGRVGEPKSRGNPWPIGLSKLSE